MRDHALVQEHGARGGLRPLCERAPLAIGQRPLLGCAQHPTLKLVQYGLVSAVIGIGVALIISLADPDQLTHKDLMIGVIMGLAIGLGSLLAEFLLLGTLVRLGLRPVLLGRCICYFLGGAAGVFLGLLLNGLVFEVPAKELGSARLGTTVTVYGAIAVAVGLTFHRIESLRRNLADKVAELRDREFAERELSTARSIQRRLMPPETASGPGYAIAASNRAASIVAGDFYDYFYLPDGSFGFAIADVAGKGIGASLQMATVKAVLPLVAASRAVTNNPVAGTLEDLNERLCEELGPREFVALFYGRFDPRTMTVEMANAGLPDPYWLCIDRSRPVETMSVPGNRLPLGVRQGTSYDSLTSLCDQAGIMLMMTDGMIERSVDDTDDPLGYERFEQILAQHGTGDCKDREDLPRWLERLQTRLNRESGDRPEQDDATVMAIYSDPETSTAAHRDRLVDAVGA